VLLYCYYVNYFLVSSYAITNSNIIRVILRTQSSFILLDAVIQKYSTSIRSKDDTRRNIVATTNTTYNALPNSRRDFIRQQCCRERATAGR